MGTSKSLQLLIVALLSFAGCARSVDYGQCSSSQIPRAPSSELAPLLDQPSSVKRAAFVKDELWLLSGAGELSKIREGSPGRESVALPEPALELCSRDGEVHVITGRRDDCRQWTWRRRIGDHWSAEGTVSAVTDRPIALYCDAEGVLLVTGRRLIEMGPKDQRSVPISKAFGGTVTSVLVRGDDVFAGVDRGEWGGGLRHIDRRTGAVTVIEGNESGSLCGGPLNTQCDPVMGLSVIPWKPGCIAATVGLEHMAGHGRLIEVCGDRVERMYVKAHDAAPVLVPRVTSSTDDARGAEPLPSVEFFDVASSRDALLVAGIDGLYRFDAKGRVETIAIREWKDFAGIKVSFEVSDFVAVLTAVRQNGTLNDGVPMIVSRAH